MAPMGPTRNDRRNFEGVRVFRVGISNPVRGKVRVQVDGVNGCEYADLHPNQAEEVAVALATASAQAKNELEEVPTNA